MKEITVPASLDELYTVLDFVETQLEAQDCSPKIMVQIAIAVEEIYVNIAKYAYHPKLGEATIRCTVEGEPLLVAVEFLDNGNPFNPLEHIDGDISVSAEERAIGGLGILMVKKSMDLVEYSYQDGNNILTMKKQLN